jgi:hypothetical protein
MASGEACGELYAEEGQGNITATFIWSWRYGNLACSGRLSGEKHPS